MATKKGKRCGLHSGADQLQSNQGCKAKGGEPKKYSKPGQPTKYREEYATNEFIAKYIKHAKKKKELISLCGFACYVKVCEDTLQEWRKVHSKFSVSLGILKQISKQMLINGGLSNKFNSTITKLMLSSNHGMAEKTETEHKISSLTDILAIMAGENG